MLPGNRRNELDIPTAHLGFNGPGEWTNGGGNSHHSEDHFSQRAQQWQSRDADTLAHYYQKQQRRAHNTAWWYHHYCRLQNKTAPTVTLHHYGEMTQTCYRNISYPPFQQRGQENVSDHHTDPREHMPYFDERQNEHRNCYYFNESPIMRETMSHDAMESSRYHDFSSDGHSWGYSRGAPRGYTKGASRRGSRGSTRSKRSRGTTLRSSEIHPKGHSDVAENHTEHVISPQPTTSSSPAVQSHSVTSTVQNIDNERELTSGQNTSPGGEHHSDSPVKTASAQPVGDDIPNTVLHTPVPGPAGIVAHQSGSSNQPHDPNHSVPGPSAPSHGTTQQTDDLSVNATVASQAQTSATSKQHGEQVAGVRKHKLGIKELQEWIGKRLRIMCMASNRPVNGDKTTQALSQPSCTEKVDVLQICKKDGQLNTIKDDQKRPSQHPSDGDSTHRLEIKSISKCMVLKAVPAAPSLIDIVPPLGPLQPPEVPEDGMKDKSVLATPNAKERTKQKRQLKCHAGTKKDLMHGQKKRKKKETGAPLSSVEDVGEARQTTHMDETASGNAAGNVTTSNQYAHIGSQVTDNPHTSSDRTHVDVSCVSEQCSDVSIDLSSVAVAHITLATLKQMVSDLDGSVTLPETKNSFSDYLVEHFWDGDIHNMLYFRDRQYEKVMENAVASCTEENSSAVFSAVKGLALGELVEKFPIVACDDSSLQEGFRSSWLNINENLDDIDKEPGVAWSLLFIPEKAEEKTQSEHVEGVETDENLHRETDRLMGAPAGSPVETETPVLEEKDLPTDPLTSIKMTVLTSKEAKKLFNLLQTHPDLEPCSENKDEVQTEAGLDEQGIVGREQQSPLDHMPNKQVVEMTGKGCSDTSCSSPCLIETEDGFEYGLCPLCQTKRGLQQDKRPAFAGEGSIGYYSVIPIAHCFSLADSSETFDSGSEEVTKEPQGQTEVHAKTTEPESYAIAQNNPEKAKDKVCRATASPLREVKLPSKSLLEEFESIPKLLESFLNKRSPLSVEEQKSSVGKKENKQQNVEVEGEKALSPTSPASQDPKMSPHGQAHIKGSGGKVTVGHQYKDKTPYSSYKRRLPSESAAEGNECKEKRSQASLKRRDLSETESESDPAIDDSRSKEKILHVAQNRRYSTEVEDDKCRHNTSNVIQRTSTESKPATKDNQHRDKTPPSSQKGNECVAEGGQHRDKRSYDAHKRRYSSESETENNKYRDKRPHTSKKRRYSSEVESATKDNRCRDNTQSQSDTAKRECRDKRPHTSQKRINSSQSETEVYQGEDKMSPAPEKRHSPTVETEDSSDASMLDRVKTSHNVAHKGRYSNESALDSSQCRDNRPHPSKKRRYSTESGIKGDKCKDKTSEKRRHSTPTETEDSSDESTVLQRLSVKSPHPTGSKSATKDNKHRDKPPQKRIHTRKSESEDEKQQCRGTWPIVLLKRQYSRESGSEDYQCVDKTSHASEKRHSPTIETEDSSDDGSRVLQHPVERGGDCSCAISPQSNGVKSLLIQESPSITAPLILSNKPQVHKMASTENKPKNSHSKHTEVVPKMPTLNMGQPKPKPTNSGPHNPSVLKEKTNFDKCLVIQHKEVTSKMSSHSESLITKFPLASQRIGQVDRGEEVWTRQTDGSELVMKPRPSQTVKSDTETNSTPPKAKFPRIPKLKMDEMGRFIGTSGRVIEDRRKTPPRALPGPKASKSASVAWGVTKLAKTRNDGAVGHRSPNATRVSSPRASGPVEGKGSVRQQVFSDWESSYVPTWKRGRGKTTHRRSGSVHREAEPTSPRSSPETRSIRSILTKPDRRNDPNRVKNKVTFPVNPVSSVYHITSGHYGDAASSAEETHSSDQEEQDEEPVDDIYVKERARVVEEKQQDAGRGPKLAPSLCEKGPKRKRQTLEPAALLMKKSIVQAKLWSSSIHPLPKDGIHKEKEQTHTFGAGYKWAEKLKRRPSETKGSCEETTETMGTSSKATLPSEGRREEPMGRYIKR